jgi:hypothetical protein
MPPGHRAHRTDREPGILVGIPRCRYQLVVSACQGRDDSGIGIYQAGREPDILEGIPRCRYQLAVQDRVIAAAGPSRAQSWMSPNWPYRTEQPCREATVALPVGCVQVSAARAVGVHQIGRVHRATL